jgi:hypothetical protein
MAEHVWKEDGVWESYTKGFQQRGRLFRCIKCNMCVKAGLSGITEIRMEDAHVDTDCNDSIVRNVLES